MWTSLFAITIAIAIALSMAAIVVDPPMEESFASDFVLSESMTWAAFGPPILLLVRHYAALELCNNKGDAAPDVIEALCATVLVPVFRGIQR